MWYCCNCESVCVAIILEQICLHLTKLPGLPTAAGSIGMLAGDLEGIKIVFKALQDSSPWTYDDNALELPWRQEKYDSIIARRCNLSGIEPNGRLVFGMLDSDDHVHPHPPIRLTLRRVKQALLRCGHEVGLLKALGTAYH